MKKLLFLFIFSFSFMLAGQAMAREQINSFTVNAYINEDSSINIEEIIIYDFGANSKHGIYRDIPLKYKRNTYNYGLRISDISVTDEYGKSYNFTFSKPFGEANIKIGDPDRYITGVHAYIIKYKVERAVNYFEDHDELYWNATGNGWGVPILYSEANVYLPQKASQDQIQIECFADVSGGQKSCLRKIINAKNNSADQANFVNGLLNPSEGLTFVVGFPKGLVYQPSRTEVIWELIKDNSIIFLPIVIFIIMFLTWYYFGRDPKGRGTIITQFDSPDSLSPAEVGTIIDQTVHQKDISADIINLAIKGYIKINRIKAGGVILKKNDYIFEKLKEDDSDLKEHEKILFNGLFEKDTAKESLDKMIKDMEAKKLNFGEGMMLNFLKSLSASRSDGEKERIKEEQSGKIVYLSKLKYKFAPSLEKVKRFIYTNLQDRGYFKKSSKKLKSFFIIIGVIIIFCMFIAVPFYGFLGAFGLLTSGVIVVIFGIFMPARTKKGVLTREHILGLKDYLTVAEKARIKFHNAPEKNPKVFERLLPYAMVLGVEKEWAKQFKDIYKEQPDWYNDYTGKAFSAVALANSLGGFQTSANSTLTATASSGSSGFSGGSSGGGFGGGGGGSW